MAEVERLCSDVLMLKTGRIVDRGSPQDLLDRYGREDMEEVFLDIARNRGHRQSHAAAEAAGGEAPKGKSTAGKTTADKTAEATA